MADNFAPATPDESAVFGACRPGYPSQNVDENTVSNWITELRSKGINRICCLLTAEQLAHYDDLLPAYRTAFGEQAVCHAPVPDYDPVPTELMQDTIRPFLSEADTRDEQVVVHCSAGQGRTGQVLSLWLAVERGYSVDDAIRTVSAQGRTPLESPSVTSESLRRAVKQISGQSD